MPEFPQRAAEIVAETRACVRNASAEDAAFLSWAILAASRGHLTKGWFDVALDQPERSCLQFLQRLTTSGAESRWHYSRFLIVDSARRPVAALCAFRAADVRLASPIAIGEVAQSVGLSPQEQAAIWKRGAYLFSSSTRSPDDSWVLESIATLASHRQRGYTSMLLAKAIENGRARGLKEAEITVVRGNAAAERTYAAAGFRCVGESLDADLQTATGAIGQRRLTRAL